MINLRDIYAYMNIVLYNRNYIYMNDEDKKRTIDYELKTYLTKKINRYNPNALEENNSNSILDLIIYIESVNETKNYFADIHQVIHFILTQMNGYIWWEDKDLESDNPIIDLEKRELHTRPDTDVIQVFDFVYKTYLEGPYYAAKRKRTNNETI